MNRMSATSASASWWNRLCPEAACGLAPLLARLPALRGRCVAWRSWRRLGLLRGRVVIRGLRPRPVPTLFWLLKLELATGQPHERDGQGKPQTDELLHVGDPHGKGSLESLPKYGSQNGPGQVLARRPAANVDRGVLNS